MRSLFPAFSEKLLISCKGGKICNLAIYSAVNPSTSWKSRSARSMPMSVKPGCRRRGVTSPTSKGNATGFASQKGYGKKSDLVHQAHTPGEPRWSFLPGAFCPNTSPIPSTRNNKAGASCWFFPLHYFQPDSRGNAVHKSVSFASREV